MKGLMGLELRKDILPEDASLDLLYMIGQVIIVDKNT